jgi:MFS family permease
MFVVILGLLCTSVPAALMLWIGTSYKAVLWGRVIQGFSAGFLMCVMAPIITVWFRPQEKGLASGLMGGSISLGSAIAVLVAPAVFLVLRNWQQMSAWLSIVGWTAFVVSLVVVFSPKNQLPSPSRPGRIPVSDGTAFKRALSAPITWIGIIVTFFTAWILQTLYNLAPAYLATDKPMGDGFGPTISGKLMLAVMIAGMIGPVIGGLLQDKVFRGNHKPVLLIGFVLCCISIYAIQFPVAYLNLLVLVACLILAGTGIQFIYPAIPVLVSNNYSIHIVGRMLGLRFGIGAFGGAAGMFAGGLAVARFGNYNVAFSLMALAAVVGFIFALFLTRSKRMAYSD